MKIAVFETYMPKFFKQVVDKWEADGHQVRYERYFNPDMVRWADVVWFDACDNTVTVGTTGNTPSGYREDWDMRKMDLAGKKIIVRAIDIEIWYGHHKNHNWEVITDVVFMTPHIRDLVLKDINLNEIGVKQHMIQCGVDLDRFAMQEEHDPKKVAWVARFWRSKGTDHMLQILAKLPKDYEIHALGQFGDYEWERAYMNDFIDRNGLRTRFHHTEHVEDQLEWFKGKGTILLTSHKEAFSYAIAEGMAMGLKPVVHHFYGAENIWPEYLWETIDEAVEMIVGDADKRDNYRRYLTDKGYTLDNMISRFEKEVING